MSDRHTNRNALHRYNGGSIAFQAGACLVICVAIVLIASGVLGALRLATEAIARAIMVWIF